MDRRQLVKYISLFRLNRNPGDPKTRFLTKREPFVWAEIYIHLDGVLSVYLFCTGTLSGACTKSYADFDPDPASIAHATSSRYTAAVFIQYLHADHR